MELFATNAPDPLHWTINSCIAAFRSVWVHFGLFRNYTKFGAKHVEQVQLMQKFVPWSRIRIFRNDTPNPPHWTLNSCFGASRSVWVYLAIFCHYTKLGAKLVELVQLMHNFVPWNRIGISATNAPDPPYWTLNSCIGAFCSVCVHFGLFRYCMKLGVKRA